MINTESIPDALREVPHWVLWRNEDVGGRTTKVPYCVAQRKVRKASSTDPKTWTSFADAVQLADTYKMAGVGFCFQNSGVAGVDFDGCRNPQTGVIDSWALNEIRKLDSYSEVSPSETGVKVFIRGKLPGPGRKWESKEIGHGGKRRAIELYDSGRYFAMTGNALPGFPLGVESRELAHLYNKLAKKSRATASSTAKTKIPAGQRHAFLLAHAGKLLRDKIGEEALEIELLRVNRELFADPKPDDEIRKKARDFFKRWQKPPIAADANKIRRHEDIPEVLSIAVADEEPVAAGLINQRTVAMFAGPSGAAKSFLALRLATSVSLGTTFLGRRCTKLPVLYLDAENPLRTVQGRVRAIAGGPVPGFKVWGGWLFDDPPPLIFDLRLLEIARVERPLIIVDSLIRFHDKDENASQEMREVMATVRAWANAGATALLLHHCGKNSLSEYRGSSDILAGVDVAYSLNKRDANELELKQIKSRDGAEQPAITIRVDFSKGTFEACELESLPIEERRQSSVEFLRSLIAQQPGITRTRLATQAGRRIQEALRILDGEEGHLWRSVEVKRARRYYLLELSRDAFPNDSRVEPRERFREIFPEHDGNRSGPHSHCTESINTLPDFPALSPLIGGRGKVRRERNSGRRPLFGTGTLQK